jgi:serine/threonine protein phosphatase PrpC
VSLRDIIDRLFGGDQSQGHSKQLPQEGSAGAVAQEALPGIDGTESRSVNESADVDGGGSVVERSSGAEMYVEESEATIETEFASGDRETDLARPMNTLIEDAVIVTQVSPEPKEAGEVPLLRAVQRCNVGNVRARNEDSTFVFTAEGGGQEPLMPFGLYIVADGMGGHHAGHKASKSVSRLVAHRVFEHIYLPLIHIDESSPDVTQEPVSDVMLDAVQTANLSIHSDEPGKDSGTTLTAALVFGRRLYVAHVGDSRAYVLANGELRQVTTDHSYVRRLQEAGQLTEEEAAVHPQRNMLYKAVGQGGQLDIDTYTQTLPINGKLVLCSDGLWGLVSDNEIQDVLKRDEPLSAKADTLVELALYAGGYDNVSVILVDFGF